MNIPRLTGATELLDTATHNSEELEKSLDHVAEVNRFLGGERSLIRSFLALHLPTATVLDVGTGSADLPRALVRAARRSGIPIRITASDLNPNMLAIARARCADYPEITVAQADALDLPFEDDSFDVATMSLALHHFDHVDHLRILAELRRVCRRAVIVSELERNRANYYGAKLLAATWWRTNRLTRHDGPLSVLRGFTQQELAELGHSTGFARVSVRRHFFFRLILIGEKR